MLEALNGKRTAAYMLLVVGLMAVPMLMTACRPKQEQKIEKPPVPVTAGEVKQKQVPLQIRVIGNVEASSTVSVRAQAGGVLTKVHFTEGQDVKKGDLLFTIDPRPYEAALKQAEANLARSRAQYENAKADEKRYAELVTRGYVSQTQYEQARTGAEAFEATMQADRAVVENAKLNLQYCSIRSPLSGRTGSLLVHEGNLIKANADTAMVTINRISPAHVSFSVPEGSIPEIKKYMAAGGLKVEAFLPRDGRPAAGRLAFIENAVDTATGTIRLKGHFDNSDRRLWPGEFVNVVLTLSVQADAVVVENRAVQTGQNGQFVFVILPDSTVEVRPVVVDRTVDNESVIKSGLKPKEMIVTDGQLRLVPGAKVEVKAETKGQGAGDKGQEKQDEGKGPKTGLPEKEKSK